MANSSWKWVEEYFVIQNVAGFSSSSFLKIQGKCIHCVMADPTSKLSLKMWTLPLSAIKLVLHGRLIPTLMERHF